MDQAPADTIVITAPRLPEAPGERTYSSFAIDPAVIEDAIRLDEALTAVPGVTLFRRNDSATANPTIQGLSVRASAPSGAGRTLVTLDGTPINDPFGGWVIWGAVPPETIGGANVIRGAGAGPYGAGALLGAVQLTERRGEGASLSLEAGELGHARASGVYEARGEAVSLMLAGMAEENDGWIPVRAGRGAADVALTSDSSAAVARLQWDGEALVFAARLSAYDESRSAGLVGADSAASGRSLALSLARPRGAFGWRLQAWASESDFTNTSVATAPDRSATTPANEQFETPALGWGLNAAMRWSYADAGVEIGADVRAADGETRERFRFIAGELANQRVAGGETLIAGAYVEAWREAGAWLLTGGARLDQWRAFGGARLETERATGNVLLQTAPNDTDALSPTARLGVRRDLGGGLFLRGAAYSGFRPPTLNELHRPFRVGNDVTEANAALASERLYGGDVALGGEGDAMTWSVGVFATRLEDAITNVTLGAGPGTFPPGVFVPAGGAYRQRQNAGTIDALGLEAEARGRWSEALSWRAALNLTDAKTDAGLRPAQSAAWSANLGLDWRTGPATTLSLTLAHESARYEDDLNARSLSPATVLDLRAEHALSPALAVYAALDNALDEAVESAESATGIESFAAPRALRFGLRLRTP